MDRVVSEYMGPHSPPRIRHFVPVPRPVKRPAGLRPRADMRWKLLAFPAVAANSAVPQPKRDPFLSASRQAEASAALLERLRRDAVELRSPCGKGSMVWHVWGAGTPIVLLHGGYGSWAPWLRNSDAPAP